MNLNDFRSKYYQETKEFLESEAGTHFRITLSMLRPQGQVKPIPGVDYQQLCAAEQKIREGYEECVTNVTLMGTPPPEPEKVRTVKYNKDRTKK